MEILVLISIVIIFILLLNSTKKKIKSPLPEHYINRETMSVEECCNILGVTINFTQEELCQAYNKKFEILSVQRENEKIEKLIQAFNILHNIIFVKMSNSHNNEPDKYIFNVSVKEIVISDFYKFKLEKLDSIYDEVMHGDYSNISPDEDLIDSYAELEIQQAIQFKRKGEYLLANRKYIDVIKYMKVLVSSVLYSWYKVLAPATAFNEALYVIRFSELIMDKTVDPNAGPWQQTAQRIELENLLNSNNEKELELYLSAIAGNEKYKLPRYNL